MTGKQGDATLNQSHLICLNGHPACEAVDSPGGEFVCRICGATLICCCQRCGARFEDDPLPSDAGERNSTAPVPASCPRCGKPFPWVEFPWDGKNLQTELFSYCEPRIMRRRTEAGEEFAIHEVYFDGKGTIIGYTEDALSPREPTVERLKESLLRLMERRGEPITSGDLQYTYDSEDVKEWLRCFASSLLDVDFYPSNVESLDGSS
ncbi:MAG: DUF2321 domain-containing protein [Armatimonadetes bacterium]|nr:DUF2321 domain-containing protein [Armatimonadota bacterium]